MECETAPESLQVAKILARLVEQESPGLVIIGKQAIDSDNNQTGQMLAALTKMPQATFASVVEVEGESLKVTREIDGGLQTLKLTMPAVVSTDLRLNEPRYAKLPDIMKAKRKPLAVMSTEELGVDITPRVTTLKVTPPPARSAGVKVENVAELMAKLRDEAKVIS